MTTCEWVTFRECGELLYGKMFPLRLKVTAYKSYVRLTIVYGSETWCDVGILQGTDRSTMRAMFGVHL